MGSCQGCFGSQGFAEETTIPILVPLANSVRLLGGHYVDENDIFIFIFARWRAINLALATTKPRQPLISTEQGINGPGLYVQRRYTSTLFDPQAHYRFARTSRRL